MKRIQNVDEAWWWKIKAIDAKRSLETLKLVLSRMAKVIGTFFSFNNFFQPHEVQAIDAKKSLETFKLVLSRMAKVIGPFFSFNNFFQPHELLESSW